MRNLQSQKTTFKANCIWRAGSAVLKIRPKLGLNAIRPGRSKLGWLKMLKNSIGIQHAWLRQIQNSAGATGLCSKVRERRPRCGRHFRMYSVPAAECRSVKPSLGNALITRQVRITQQARPLRRGRRRRASCRLWDRGSVITLFGESTTFAYSPTGRLASKNSRRRTMPKSPQLQIHLLLYLCGRKLRGSPEPVVKHRQDQ